ncbi:uncharacterized protein LOC114288479 [Camellia sinensis]|uniref:uncharacterized protein LOC114288479 n=1 Tax=Camellia sinensis TaxID=4442 RepID=UPI0010360153|nr:uncharacterized protein LOC114288479 [Camellia sinensis]
MFKERVRWDDPMAHLVNCNEPRTAEASYQQMWHHQILQQWGRKGRQVPPMSWLSMGWMKMLMKKCFVMSFTNMLQLRIFVWLATNLLMFQGDLLFYIFIHMTLLDGYQRNIIQTTSGPLVGRSQVVERLQVQRMLLLYNLALFVMKHLAIITMLLLDSIMMEIQVFIYLEAAF